MISRFTKSNKWYDVLALLIVIVVICAAIQIVAPGSGIAKAIHTGFHALSLFVEWLAGGLTALSQLLNQL